MARSERQPGGTRGGVGTMTRQGTRPRPPQAPDPGQAVQDPGRGRQPRPVPPPRPDASPRTAQGAGAAPRTADRPDRRVPAKQAPAKQGTAKQGTPKQAPARRSPAEQRSGTGGRAAGGQRGDAAEAAAPPARKATRPRIGAPWRVPPAGRTTGPQPTRTTGPQPVRATGPQQAIPSTQAAPGQATQAQAAQAGPAARPAALSLQSASAHRMPFVLLLCGLLGGALVSALVISTTLAEGSFQITKLQESTTTLSQQSQTLQDQVAQAQSSQQIEQEAAKLGMRRPGELRFIDLKTGKTTNDGPTWIGAVNAPGYAP